MYKLNQTEKPRKILVVGGGVAGMEAARVAAIRGHKVSLYEKSEALGGHLIEASVPDFKKDLNRLEKWYETQLKKLGVKAKLETEASEATIDKENPDAVIIATGSKPIIPNLPGIKRANVFTCIDLLLGKKKAGKSAVVIGGGLVGCETALWLAQQGKEVTIVEMLPKLMTKDPEVPNMNKAMLLDLLAMNKVNVVTDASVQEIKAEGAIVIGKTLGNKVIKADTIVLALGLKSNDTLYKKLTGKVANLYALGDCQDPRDIMGAVWDGYEVGRTV